jgi:hypothetical protein
MKMYIAPDLYGSISTPVGVHTTSQILHLPFEDAECSLKDAECSLKDKDCPALFLFTLALRTPMFSVKCAVGTLARLWLNITSHVGTSGKLSQKSNQCPYHCVYT